MRDHLHGLAEVFSVAFLLYYAVVYLSGGEIVLAGQIRRGEPLIVAQVKIGLGTVISDKNLAVLERAHGPGIHIDVRVQLDVVYLEPSRFHDCPDRCCSKAFSQRREHTSGDEYVFRGLFRRHGDYLP